MILKNILIFLLMSILVGNSSAQLSTELQNIVSNYQSCELKYTKSVKKAFFKNLKKDHGFGFNYHEVKKYDLSFLAIPFFKLRMPIRDTSSIENIFQHLEFKKSYGKAVFVTKEGQYFGNYFYYPKQTYRSAAEILLEYKVNGEIRNNDDIHELDRTWYQTIKEFQADLVFMVGETRLSPFLLKDNQVYVLGYFNGQQDIIIPLKKWVQSLDFEWYKLLNKEVFHKDKN